VVELGDEHANAVNAAGRDAGEKGVFLRIE